MIERKSNDNDQFTYHILMILFTTISNEMIDDYWRLDMDVKNWTEIDEGECVLSI